jgi:hypothetical protein
MRRANETKADQDWLKRFGKNVEELILKRGFKSPYDFWVNKAGDDLSRAALNYIVAGRTDPKATTLRVLAKLLDVKPSKLIDFE